MTGPSGAAPETDVLSDPGPAITITPPVATAASAVERLKAQGADLIIALTHDDLADDRAVASSVEGINLILGGHDHNPITFQEGDTLIVKAGYDAHYLAVSKAATAFWGIFACVVATYAATLGSLIEVVNQFGSFFYGSILGVFLLALLRGSSARGAFVGLVAGMTAVGFVAFRTDVAYLWQNVIGAAVVVGVGVVLSGRRTATA